MNAKIAMGVILGGLIVAGVPDVAEAGHGPYFARYYGGACIVGYHLDGYHTARRPPYFAMFPPVYYSGPVWRPYRLSPYARPPVHYGSAVRGPGYHHRQASAVPVSRGTPKRVHNPYASGTAEPAAPAKTPGGPLRIRNPHVARGGDAAAVRLATVPQ